MPVRDRSSALVLALLANAVLLLAILVVLLGRQRPLFTSSAMADPTQGSIAGGNGVYVMPCQLHPSVWGCYLLDTDRQTLCTYEYRAGEKLLVLTAARSYRYDTALRNLNTYPAWYDIQKMIEEEQRNQRDVPQAPSAPDPNGQ